MFNIQELSFLLGAVDGVRSASTAEAAVKGSLLVRLSVELEKLGAQPELEEIDEETVSEILNQ